MADFKFPTNNPSKTEFSSDAIDRLTTRLAQIQGLASCLTVLGHPDAESSGHSLIDEALPMLGTVMRDLADDAKVAADALWDQSSGLHSALEMRRKVAA